MMTKSDAKQRNEQAADAGLTGEATSKPGFNRRRFVGAAAAAIAAGPMGILGLTRRLDAMAEVAQQAGVNKTDIRQFHVSFPDSDLAELRRRINATRWPERETVNDSSQGVQLVTLQ